MTQAERNILIKYDSLIEKGVEKFTDQDKKDFLLLSSWCIENDIDLSLIPRKK